MRMNVDRVLIDSGTPSTSLRVRTSPVKATVVTNQIINLSWTPSKYKRLQNVIKEEDLRLEIGKERDWEKIATKLNLNTFSARRCFEKWQREMRQKKPVKKKALPPLGSNFTTPRFLWKFVKVHWTPPQFQALKKLVEEEDLKVKPGENRNWIEISRKLGIKKFNNILCSRRWNSELMELKKNRADGSNENSIAMDRLHQLQSDLDSSSSPSTLISALSSKELSKEPRVSEPDISMIASTSGRRPDLLNSNSALVESRLVESFPAQVINDSNGYPIKCKVNDEDITLDDTLAAIHRMNQINWSF